jgi:lipopolysaccharide/colanic/teichoic acid biosynthesis glycosyltransferase
MTDMARSGSYVQRRDVLDELYHRFATAPGGFGAFSHRFRFWRKRLLWRAVVGGAVFVKRALDIVVSLAGLLVLSPLFALVAIAIKATDGGDAVYWQSRVGTFGREFPFPKFRSMIKDADKMKDALLAQSHHQDAKTFKMKDDPRVTWIGRIIRKLSIDELPQLWCVLKGDMTLVGPRPPVPREVALYTLADRRRLEVTPGLTCIWQVSGRGDIPFPQQVELDVRYIESQSFFLDLKILFQTVPAVLTGRGAY